jgi:hypothetical protein
VDARRREGRSLDIELEVIHVSVRDTAMSGGTYGEVNEEDLSWLEIDCLRRRKNRTIPGDRRRLTVVELLRYPFP